MLSDALDGAGLYVGMTRGRLQNTLHVVAPDLDDAREQFATALQRDRADRGLTAATRAAREAVTGLAPDGPVTFVNAERARLRELIRTAEPEATRWETARDELDRLGASHRIEHEAVTRALADAEAAVPRACAEVTAPLTVQATADGARCLEAGRTAGQAYDVLRRSGRFGRRAAQRAHSTAHQTQLEIESATSRRWGGTPFGGGNLEAWAAAVAERRAEADPRVVQARETVASVAARLRDLKAHHGQSLVTLCREVGDGQSPRSIRAMAEHWRGTVDQASRALTEIEALPAHDASRLIRDRAAQAAAERAADDARRAQAAERARQYSLDPVYRSSPDRGFGPSL